MLLLLARGRAGGLCARHDVGGGRGGCGVRGTDGGVVIKFVSVFVARMNLSDCSLWGEQCDQILY